MYILQPGLGCSQQGGGELRLFQSADLLLLNAQRPKLLFFPPPCSTADLLASCSQARVALERKQFQSAESLFLKAKRPELALKMFRDQRMYHDALRIAEDYLPGKVAEIQVSEGRASRAGQRGGLRQRGARLCTTTCCTSQCSSLCK